MNPDVSALFEVGEDFSEVVAEVAHESDKISLAVPPAIAGVGGCGNNQADEFYNLGCRSVLDLNLTGQDMQQLKLPEKNRYLFGDREKNGEVGGAGKDMAYARQLAQANRENIVQAMLQAYSPTSRQGIVCAGLGGGTGAGAFPVVVDAMRTTLETLHPNDVKSDLIVGAVLTLPCVSDGDRSRRNAAEVMKEALRMLEDGTLNNIVFADNTRLENAPRMTMAKLYPAVNRQVVQQLVKFNYIASLGGGLRQFDPANYRVLLKSGVLHFGTVVYDTTAPSGATALDLATVMRGALENNNSALFAKNDLKQGNSAACLLFGNPEDINNIEMVEVSRGLQSLERIVADRNNIYCGVYGDASVPRGKIFISTIVGGVMPTSAYMNSLP